MKNIIGTLKIKNFKGMLDKEISFTENRNIIEGENGIGKTTILDAITWCLFGKNFSDEKLFKIKPIIDGEEKKDLATKVELQFGDKLIERIWDKDTTTIKVDGVKFGNRELTDYLRDSLNITEEEFKALSNINYIPNLHWKDLRGLILGLVGEIKNEEIYEKGNFDLIKEKIESVGVEKTAENITETKSQLSNDIKKILGNIDQKTKDIQELVIDEKEQKELSKQKEKIKKDIENYNALSQKKSEQEKEVNILNNLKADKERTEKEIARLEQSKVEYQKTYDESNIDVTIFKENQIKSIENKITQKRGDIDLLNQEKTTIIVQRQELKKRYDEELAREPRIEDDKCSACGQALPPEKIEEVLTNLKKQAALNANGYADQAKIKKARLDEIEIVLSKYKEDIQNLEEEKINVMNSEIGIDAESDIQIMMKKNIEKASQDISTYRNQLVEIDTSIKFRESNIAKHEVIELNDDISLMQAELEEITQKLAVSDTVTIFKEQLKKLEEEHQELLKEKELLNEREQQLILFNNTRAEMLRERVRHNFKLADFITQETTKDGKLIETFKLAVDGIEYSSLNTGMKILVALDLIDNIQRLKNKRLPILIDGLGELTRLPKLDTQVIGCRAKFQVNKKMELVEE